VLSTKHYRRSGYPIMSDLFPPIYESARVNTRYDPIPRTEVSSNKSYRVFNDKQIIDETVLTTYDRSGNLKTVINKSQMVDYFA